VNAAHNQLDEQSNTIKDEQNISKSINGTVRLSSLRFMIEIKGKPH
jgi:hypothetical protein